MSEQERLMCEVRIWVSASASRSSSGWGPAPHLTRINFVFAILPRLPTPFRNTFLNVKFLAVSVFVYHPVKISSDKDTLALVKWARRLTTGAEESNEKDVWQIVPEEMVLVSGRGAGGGAIHSLEWS